MQFCSQLGHKLKSGQTWWNPCNTQDMAFVLILLVCLGVRITHASWCEPFNVKGSFWAVEGWSWDFERGLGWFWGPVGYWLWRLHIIGRHGEAEATQGQGAPSLHSQRQRIPATTTAVPTRLLTRCPQNMLKTPIYAQNSKMYQIIKIHQIIKMHRIIKIHKIIINLP